MDALLSGGQKLKSFGCQRTKNLELGELVPAVVNSNMLGHI